MAFFRGIREPKEKRKPDFNIGDHVRVNWHSDGYRGREGTVENIWTKDGYWYVSLNEYRFNLYAYKFDLVSRAAESNNEIAWERHMIAGDPFEPEKEIKKIPENHWGLPF